MILIIVIITNQYQLEVPLKIITNTMKAEEIKNKKNIGKAISLHDYATFS